MPLSIHYTIYVHKLRAEVLLSISFSLYSHLFYFFFFYLVPLSLGSSKGNSNSIHRTEHNGKLAEMCSIDVLIPFVTNRPKNPLIIEKAKKIEETAIFCNDDTENSECDM